MPLLTYSVSDFVAFTKIRSADVNARFNDIKTLLNTTKLDDTNLQDAGITRATKLKTGTNHAIVVNSGTGTMSELSPGAVGTVLKSLGSSSALTFGTDSLFTQFDAVVGSSAQVTAGTANYSSINTAIAALTAGDKMLILEGSFTENVSIDKQLYVMGQGRGTVITGTMTLTSAAGFSNAGNMKFTDNITLDSGLDGAIISPLWLATGKSFIDNTAASAVNFLFAIQE